MNKTEVLRHLEKMVGLYPCTQDQAAVLRALQYCAGVLRKSGSFPDITMHDDAGFHSLTASTQATKTPKLLLQAHVDVVPAPKSLRFIHGKNKVTGRGVYDMLFATACYLTFIEERTNKGLSNLDIGIMLTGDEEIGGFHGTNYLLDKGYGCQVCLLPDAGKQFGDLNIAAKGVYGFELVALGKSHHGSRPWEGDGAANKLVMLLGELLRAFEASDRNNSTLSVTRLAGGDANNKAPSQASAYLDVRYKDKADLQSIEKLVTDICHRYGAEIRNVTMGDDYKLDLGNAYVKSFIKLYEKHAKQPITLGKAHGSSDARFFAAKGIPVIMMRPDGTGAHGDEETLSIESLCQFYPLFEEFIIKTAKIESREHVSDE